jgi:hypothetical protein
MDSNKVTKNLNDQRIRRSLSFNSNRTETVKTVSENSPSKNQAKDEGADIDNGYVVQGVLNISSPNNSHGSHSYRAKLISKKQRAQQNAAHRSQSTTRQESSCQTNNDIFTFMRRAKRSLSAPRYFDIHISK